MQEIDARSTVGELAKDLAWLEEHCRREPTLGAEAGRLRFASALARNVVGPFLEKQPANPQHIAVVGGAGAGKSTIVNFLAGAVVAESNPQAGYTRHPTAFLLEGSAFPWPSYLGFLGSLVRIGEERPANVDEDVYQVRRVPQLPGPNPLADFVVWDCPDMTTWASAGYVGRLMEVAALADLVIYVASDERYNDEVPTQFLHLLIQAGKALVVVLTKMEEGNAEAIIGHFRDQVLGRLPKGSGDSAPVAPVLAFPHMPQEVRGDPSGAGSRFRISLLNQILVQCAEAPSVRKRTVAHAVKYLKTAGESLLSVARRDLAELESWKLAVNSGKLAFEERYRREYLSGESFRRFDRYREQLLDLLELPGAGRLFGNVMWVLRAPYRLARSSIAAMIARPDILHLSEQTVLSASLQGWLDSLRAESLKKSSMHPVWKNIALGFDAGLESQARDRFQQDLRIFELKETDDLERAGQQMVDSVEKHPVVLLSLRGVKLAADAAVVGAVIYLTWFPAWYQLLLIPLGVSGTQQAAEFAARAVADSARSRVRNQREKLVSAHLAEPLAGWLTERPATGGSDIERLHQVLHAVPRRIEQLEESVKAKG